MEEVSILRSKTFCALCVFCETFPSPSFHQLHRLSADHKAIVLGRVSQVAQRI